MIVDLSPNSKEECDDDSNDDSDDVIDRDAATALSEISIIFIAATVNKP